MVALFEVVLRHPSGDESRFGDYSGAAHGPPRINGQNLVGGATILIGGQDWLVADESALACTKFICTPVSPTPVSKSVASRSSRN